MDPDYDFLVYNVCAMKHSPDLPMNRMEGKSEAEMVGMVHTVGVLVAALAMVLGPCLVATFHSRSEPSE